MKIKNIVIAFALLSSVNVTFASQEYGCIQYQRKDYTWGEPYKVPMTVVSGDDLNEATNSYKYKTYMDYAIAEWPNGGYSVLELPSYLNDLPYSYTRTQDQNGRTYQIKEAPSYGECSRY
ncbi:hypothetical protein [Vibrio parahaemolyticus]|uniref:hypothetical protein n=2 Tax=Vibrio parahaemolyticus TaxID=670 RepID=UPI000405FA46|nr:hypothetical protein [Vibrio parahaemolyticus]ELA6667941.1 hypothetical protein [Vibrio parahaemolyticus]MQF57101.1 hypothetical protein [Vibrio parahaemolyticus]HBB9986385.1 hypothetical protein [Vibrio parahaemolyticus]HCE1923298.1 hypothetical protein [Vibrio parahaemolyticus]